jgi:hypothetical protein
LKLKQDLLDEEGVSTLVHAKWYLRGIRLKIMDVRSPIPKPIRSAAGPLRLHKGMRKSKKITLKLF